MTLEELYTIIEKRKQKLPNNSYVANLFEKGLDHISQKVGEESIELIIASKNNNKRRIIEETADLWFHILVLLSYLEIKPEEVFKELEKRHKK